MNLKKFIFNKNRIFINLVAGQMFGATGFTFAFEGFSIKMGGNFLASITNDYLANILEKIEKAILFLTFIGIMFTFIMFVFLIFKGKNKVKEQNKEKNRSGYYQNKIINEKNKKKWILYLKIVNGMIFIFHLSIAVFHLILCGLYFTDNFLFSTISLSFNIVSIIFNCLLIYLLFGRVDFNTIK